MASSSSNPNVIVEVGEECPYPYPSNLSATSFISVKLSARDEYDMWKTQMLCLLKSHGMYGFIDGTFVSPQTSFAGKAKLGYDQNHSLWIRSDAVVKGWILGSLSKPTLGFVLNRVTKKHHQGRNADDFSAKDVWDELRTIYGPAVLPHQQAISGPPPQQTFYGPPLQEAFNGPPPQQTFQDPPPQQNFYGPRPSFGPPPQQTFQDPPPRQTFNGPPPQQTFPDRPPQQPFNGPPPQQTFPDRPPQQPFYGPPPQQTFPDRPPQQPFYGPPPQQTFPDPPQQTTYGPVVGPQLQPMYGPAVPSQLQTTYGPYDYPQPVVADLYREAEKIRAAAYKNLYDATLREKWDDILDIVSQGQVTVIDKITNDENTALHVAIGNTKKPQLIENLLVVVPENTQLLNLRNKGGRTLLHVAAIVGNTEAARMLLEKDPDLLFAEDKEGHTPLALALSNKNTETSEQILKHFSSRITNDTRVERGDELLVTAISSKNFDLAKRLMYMCWELNSDAVLMALAQNFPCELSTFEIYLGTNHITNSVLRHYVRSAFSNTVDICVPLCGPSVAMYLKICFDILYRGIRCIIVLLLKIPKILVRPFVEERARNYSNCISLLLLVCSRLTMNSYNSVSQLYTNPLFEATRQDSHKVVENIVFTFINAIHSTNEDGHNIMQYAVISRSQKVYSLLHEMSEHNTFFKTTKDSCENNILHLAARLAPTNKLNLISGAALQIQRELQWFKEIERFVSPHSILQKNAFDETPHMIFSREHKDLVIEGEKWMKATAESYTITAALITTIVFAAAITVPGGNNQDTGIPLFTDHTAFTIFAISDAISLFGAVTSLLMFLSILTARFAEQDFLFKLPTKLLIGLATLFISTAAMIVAFGATLHIVFAQSKPMMLIPIVLLTCIPIICFVTLQFPLIKDLMSKTYGHSIFGKIINRDFD